MANEMEPIAVIDLGSHSIRMEIAQYDSKGRKETLEYLSHPVFIGNDVFTKGKISAGNIRHIVDILSDFARVMKEYGVVHYKAIATSAVRETSNRDIMLNRIKISSGITVNVLEATEEMKLIFLAVKKAVAKRFGLLDHNAIICSIGTGSTQFACIEKGHLHNVQTLQFGTLRLIEEIFSDFSSRRLKDSIDPFVANVVNRVARMDLGKSYDVLIAVGASVRSLVSIQRGGELPKHMATMSRKGFKKIFDVVVNTQASELVEKYNIPDSVALGLETCCDLLDHLLKVTNTDKLLIPIINTRDIIQKELVRDISGKIDKFEDEVISSVKFVGRKYSYDEKHAETVTKFALDIFDRLLDLHKLPPRSRMYLEVAGLLHDIGQFINNRQHHKHSLYLINNTPFPGLSSEEREIISVIARYHRRAIPKTSHIEYMGLSSDNRVLVCKLASILRIADALDRSHHDRIKIQNITYDDETLEINIANVPDLTIEKWGLKKKADLFTETYGLKVSLIQ